jgi:phosphonate transport system substrate-binding protein
VFFSDIGTSQESQKNSNGAEQRRVLRFLNKHLVSFLLVVTGTIFVIIFTYLMLNYSRQYILEKDFADKEVIRLDRQVGIGGAVEKQPLPPLPSLRIAIAPVISPEKSFLFYKDFVEYIAAVVGRNGILITRSTYGEVNGLLREQRCDMALVCTLSYLRGKNEFGLKLLAAPVIKGNIHYRSHIVVPRDSAAKGLLDLKGKSFASADIMSTSGWLYPAVWLKKRGINPLMFFKKHELTGSHDRSIQAVANRNVDGAAVDSIVYDQTPKKIKKKVRVINTSPSFGMPPMVTPKQLNPELRERLLNALLAAHNDPRGKAILSALEIDRFEVVQDDLYDSVEDLELQWQTPQ